MNLPHLPTLMLTSLLLAATSHAVELRFLNWEGAENALKFSSKNTTVSIHATENTLSPVYLFEDDGPLMLFKETTHKDKMVRTPAGTLTVPPGLTHAIIVLTATDKSRTTYAGTWIDDSPATRPAGTIKMVNLSRHQVGVKMGSETFTLAATESHQATPPSAKSRIVVEMWAQTEGRQEPVANNPVVMRPGLRLLLLLRDGRPQEGSKTNIVDVLSFYDRPPATPVAPTPSDPR